MILVTDYLLLVIYIGQLFSVKVQAERAKVLRKWCGPKRSLLVVDLPNVKIDLMVYIKVVLYAIMRPEEMSKGNQSTKLLDFLMFFAK